MRRRSKVGQQGVYSRAIVRAIPVLRDYCVFAVVGQNCFEYARISSFITFQSPIFGDFRLALNWIRFNCYSFVSVTNDYWHPELDFFVLHRELSQGTHLNCLSVFHTHFSEFRVFVFLLLVKALACFMSVALFFY